MTKLPSSDGEKRVRPRGGGGGGPLPPLLPVGVILATMLAPAVTVAQEEQAGEPAPAVLEGTVLREPGSRPIEGARVELLVRRRSAATDALGRFRFGDLTPGGDTLRVSLLDGTSRLEPVTLVAGRLTRAELRVEENVIELRELEVTVSRPASSRVDRLAERVGRKAGQFLDRETLEKHAGAFALAFQRLRGVHVDYEPRTGFVVLLRRIAGMTGSDRSRRGRFCRPTLFLDGREAPVVEIEDFQTFEVGFVEVHDGRTLPPEFVTPATLDCGAVVIWTREYLARGG